MFWTLLGALRVITIALQLPITYSKSCYSIITIIFLIIAWWCSVPAGSPLNVSSTNVTSSSARLQWDPPAQRHRNGIIVLYEVMYRLKDNYIDDWTTNTSDPWIVIEGLEPDHDYQFQIRAYTSQGSGPWSDQHVLQTLPHSKLLADTTDSVVDLWLPFSGPLCSCLLLAHILVVYIYNPAFCVVDPVTWNSLPLDIRSAPTLSAFKNMLKTSCLTFLLHWLTVSSEHCTAPL